MHGEAQEGMALEYEVRLGLVDQVSVVVFQRFTEVLEDVLPVDGPFG